TLSTPSIFIKSFKISCSLVSPGITEMLLSPSKISLSVVNFNAFGLGVVSARTPITKSLLYYIRTLIIAEFHEFKKRITLCAYAKFFFYVYLSIICQFHYLVKSKSKKDAPYDGYIFLFCLLKVILSHYINGPVITIINKIDEC